MSHVLSVVASIYIIQSNQGNIEIGSHKTGLINIKFTVKGSKIKVT